MDEDALLQRITVDPEIFGGKPIIRGRRLAVEHVLGMLAAGDDLDTLLEGYPWLEQEDVLACLAYARRLVAHERVEPTLFGATEDQRRAFEELVNRYPEAEAEHALGELLAARRWMRPRSRPATFGSRRAPSEGEIQDLLRRYLDEEISLAKMAASLGISRFELMERFQRLGVPSRTGPADLEEAREEIETARAQE